MNENRVVSLRQKDEIDDPLTEILRTGARRLITRAVEVEFDTFLASNVDLALADGRQRVVRHGHDPVRTIQTGIGPVEVQKPKARDRGAPEAGERIRFASSILPKWARRTKSLDALLPVLYLRGISAGDFQEVLTALLGKDAPNLSPAVIARLKASGKTSISGGKSAIYRRAAMFTCGRTASICRRGWSHKPSACWY
jgi:putative transposase